MTGDPESHSRPDVGIGLTVGVSVAFLAIAASKLWSGLSPSSLYLDDQWVAVALKEAGPGALLALHLPMPVGFTMIADFLVRLVPNTGLALQLLPVLAYLTSIALFPVLVHRLTGSAWASAVGVALIASVPLTETYAVRAKHYTLDELVTIALLLGMTSLFTSPRARSFMRFAGLSLVGVLLSFASVFLSSSALLVAGLSARRLDGPGAEGERRRIALTAGALLLAEGVFYLAYLRLSSRPIMQAFWMPYFLPLDAWSNVWAFFSERVPALFVGAMPVHAHFLLLFAPLGLLWLWRSGRREYCATIAVLYGLILLASALWVYPVGTGRTDIFTIPVTVLLSCLGLYSVVGWIRPQVGRRLVYACLLVGLVALELWSPSAVYPPNGDREAVAWVSERIEPSDGLVLSPYGALAYSTFGNDPVRLRPVDFYGHGFDAFPDRPLTFRSFLGVWGVTGDETVRTELGRLAAFLDGAPPRVFYLVTNPTLRSRSLVLSAFGAYGYQLTEPHELAGGEAGAFLFERRAPST